MLSQGLASTERREGRVLRRLSQSLAADRQVRCAQLVPGILLEAVGYSCLFLAQALLHDGRSRAARLQHPGVHVSCNGGQYQ